MSEGTASVTRAATAPPLFPALTAGALALVAGLAAGDPGSGLLLPLAGVLGCGLVGVIAARPFAGLLALVFSLFLLMIVPVAGTHRAVNVFDVAMIPVLAASLIGGARSGALAGDALATGPAHDAMRVATRRFAKSAILYFGLAALSLPMLAIRLGSGPAFDSGYSLVRVLQGALLFPLGLWWLRDERRIRWVLHTVFAAAVAFSVVNCVWVFGLGVSRAGIVWSVSDARDAITSPNEAAAALVLLWALVQVCRGVQPRRWHLPLLGLVLVMLPLTQSRSGLLALATLLLMTMRRIRWRWVLGVLAFLAVALPLLPAVFWERMAHTLTLRPGSNELFSILVRFYGYRTAWHVFLDNPVFGVGYLGYRFVSVHYNEFHLLLVTTENFLLETMVGLGLVGLGAVAVVLWRLYALGSAVRRTAPAGTLAHELARLHGPLVTALLVANLTGSTFVGMVGVGQLALWCALLVRAGHLAQDGARRPGSPEA